jgi:predicted RNA-binding protein (virulence factor B family)
LPNQASNSGKFLTTDGSNASWGTLPNVGSPVTLSFVKITTDAQGRVSATTAVTTSDITSLVDNTYVNISGDTMTGCTYRRYRCHK